VLLSFTDLSGLGRGRRVGAGPHRGIDRLPPDRREPYTFAKAYYSERGGIFAGIVRLAGQSEETLPGALADRTSVWYHIGLQDDAVRVTTAENAYQFIKNYTRNTSAAEYVKMDELASFPRKTKTLAKNGIGIMKKSEYTGMGHDGGTAFSDPDVLAWLFSQSLANR
jgi:hypothetical protein